MNVDIELKIQLKKIITKAIETGTLIDCVDEDINYIVSSLVKEFPCMKHQHEFRKLVEVETGIGVFEEYEDTNICQHCGLSR